MPVKRRTQIGFFRRIGRFRFFQSTADPDDLLLGQDCVIYHNIGESGVQHSVFAYVAKAFADDQIVLRAELCRRIHRVCTAGQHHKIFSRRGICHIGTVKGGYRRSVLLIKDGGSGVSQIHVGCRGETIFLVEGGGAYGLAGGFPGIFVKFDVMQGKRTSDLGIGKINVPESRFAEDAGNQGAALRHFGNFCPEDHRFVCHGILVASLRTFDPCVGFGGGRDLHHPVFNDNSFPYKLHGIRRTSLFRLVGKLCFKVGTLKVPFTDQIVLRISFFHIFGKNHGSQL